MHHRLRIHSKEFLTILVYNSFISYDRKPAKIDLYVGPVSIINKR
ncbi:hypothetical protein ABH968_003763 [Lysinibacillus sp. RC79]